LSYAPALVLATILVAAPVAVEILGGVAREGGLPIDVVAYSDLLADRSHIINNAAHLAAREAHSAAVACMSDGIRSLTAAMLDDALDGRAE